MTMMKELTPTEIEALRKLASGPVSFRADGERLTASEDWMMCASTYRTMMHHGWIARVIV